MIYDFQRASTMKRMMAWLLDFIVIITLAVGCLWGITQFVDVMPEVNAVSGAIDKYEAQFGGYLTVPTAELEKMTEEEKTAVEAVSQEIAKALNEDAEAVGALQALISKFLMIVSLSFLGAFLVWEFAIPLFLKNGQTVGKKCFGIALMRKDGIKVTPFMVFARAILGKCTVETLLPIMILITFFNSFGLLLAGGFLVLQVAVALATRNKTAIHDLMACTVAVDLSSQMIFDSVEEMEEYHQRIREEIAQRDDY